MDEDYTNLFVTGITDASVIRQDNKPTTVEKFANDCVDGTGGINVSYYKVFVKDEQELKHNTQYKYDSANADADAGENPNYKIVKIIKDDKGEIKSCNVCENTVISENVDVSKELK